MSFINNLVTWINKKSDKELGATLKAIDNELNSTLADIKNLDNEFILHSSSGMFLDEHGDWYGFPRRLQESDEDYRARIWKEINRSRLTIPSIKSEIESMLPEGSYVTIIEPYKFIFRFNISSLSDEHLIRDNDYASHGVIDIRINGPINADIKGIVEELRAGGIKVHVSGEYMEYLSMADEINDYGKAWYEQITELICHRNWQDSFVLNHSLLGDTGAFPSAGAITWFYPEVTLELSIPTFPHSGLFSKIPVQYLDSVTPTFLNNVHELGGENPISGISYKIENLYEDIYLDSLFLDSVIELSRNDASDDVTDIGTPTWDDIHVTSKSNWLNNVSIHESDDTTVELTPPLRLGSGYLPDLPDKYKNLVKDALRANIEKLGDNDFVTSGGSVDNITDEDITLENAGAFRFGLHALSGVNPLSGIPSDIVDVYTAQYLGNIYVDSTIEMKAIGTNEDNFSGYEVEVTFPKLNLDAKLLGMYIETEHV